MYGIELGYGVYYLLDMYSFHDLENRLAATGLFFHAVLRC